MGGNYSNAEGYADPTAGEAITQVIKENRTYKPLVYICSQFSGDIIGNTEKAKRYSRFAVDADAIPIAPHLLLPLYMKETEERELAMFMDMVILGVFFPITECNDANTYAEMKVQLQKAYPFFDDNALDA